jgi:hypothetical protein
MRSLLLALLLLVAGCQPVTTSTPTVDEAQLFIVEDYGFTTESPVVNLPYSLRYWNTQHDGGSCVHRSMGNLFNWMGQPELASYWINEYTGGEYPDHTFSTKHNLASKLTAEGIPFVYTLQDKDVEFLEWSIATRRGCNVTVMGGVHMVTLVHLDKDRAGILDNNDPRKIIWVTRKSFLNEWFSSNSWAVTPLFDPVPPK